MIRHSSFVIRHFLLLALLSAPSLTFAQSPPTTFPTSDTLSYERFALFIGIDKYPVLKTFDLDGCVNDALAYKRIFVDDRFGIERYAVLTNEQATRDGITKALLDLVQQVKTARTKTDKPITVVITYSGHGARVPRTDKSSPLGPLDSSWVASDSDAEGTKNIRGEELFAVHSALRKLGAQVIMISDSCHSGTAYRGTDKVRGIELSRDASGPPPADKGPFADLLKEAQLPPAPAALTTQPGFVWYAACSDNQQAFETTDEKGGHCGRMSLVMRKILLTSADTTYSSIARQITQEFSARWPNSEGQQTPEFHAAAGKENELFFRGGFAPLHALIKKTDATANTVDITLGQLQGISEGTRFQFFAGATDALAHRNSLATGTVLRADPLTSTVKLDAAKAIPLTAWAMPDIVRMQDFTIAVDGPAPAWLAAKLAELDKGEQLKIVPLDKSPSVVLHVLPNNAIGLYRPTALPPVDGATTKPPAPLRLLTPPEKPDAYPELLAQNLLYLARIQRLATLDHVPTASLTDTAAEANLPPLTAEISRGLSTSPGQIPQLKDGDEFALKIANNTSRNLFITVFGLNNDGTIDVLYPAAGDDVRPVLAGRTLDIGKDGPFVAVLNNKSLAVERTHIKVIATDTQVDFTPLLVAPETGGKNVRGLESKTRGGDNPLFDLLRDTLHGGPLTRDVAKKPPPSDWGTTSLLFDVYPK